MTERADPRLLALTLRERLSALPGEARGDFSWVQKLESRLRELGGELGSRLVLEAGRTASLVVRTARIPVPSGSASSYRWLASFSTWLPFPRRGSLSMENRGWILEAPGSTDRSRDRPAVPLVETLAATGDLDQTVEVLRECS